MEVYIAPNVWKTVAACVVALVVAFIIAMVISPSGPETAPSVRTESLIFDSCLREADDSNDQPGVVRECRIAAAQMTGRLPRTQ